MTCERLDGSLADPVVLADADAQLTALCDTDCFLNLVGCDHHHSGRPHATIHL